MTGFLEVLATASQITVQDLGRTGWTALGLAPGGAADRRALWEAAALLGQRCPGAVLEMPLTGGRFRLTEPSRIALTGAPMRARLAGHDLVWNASHLIPAGAEIEIGPAEAGVYGYLALAGGITTPEALGARATLAAAGLGTVLTPGQRLPFAKDPAPQTPARRLPAAPRFSGGTLRVIPGPQTGLFEPETRAHAFATRFLAGPASRQGVTLQHAGAPFESQTAGLLSDFITAGDIQITGAGTPVILLAECQSIGGYPRLGTVIPTDLPIAAQARPGTPLRLALISLEEAEAASPPEAEWLGPLVRVATPLLRRPHDIPDLLGYQLISGVVRGDEEDGCGLI
ncbi:biotin-dependent carboxyltransferase family protein [Rhodobacter lacus]|uniref:Biotin-dependent carboxyltransferase family protein n=1 Tax=Rhodobacter lacus TaxID=1641972 RepID=A0ABW5ACE0_9RHOB